MENQELEQVVDATEEVLNEIVKTPEITWQTILVGGLALVGGVVTTWQGVKVGKKAFKAASNKVSTLVNGVAARKAAQIALNQIEDCDDFDFEEDNSEE